MLPKVMHLYSDGSYNPKKDQAGFGIVLLEMNNEEVIQEKRYFGAVKEHLQARNVAGELAGIIKGIDYAIENDATHITIFYDYEGCEKWITNEWTARKPISQRYVQKLLKLIRENNLNVTFEKVTAHSGNKYNELADRLAKKGSLK